MSITIKRMALSVVVASAFLCESAVAHAGGPVALTDRQLDSVTAAQGGPLAQVAAAAAASGLVTLGSTSTVAVTGVAELSIRRLERAGDRGGLRRWDEWRKSGHVECQRGDVHRSTRKLCRKPQLHPDHLWNWVDTSSRCLGFRWRSGPRIAIGHSQSVRIPVSGML